MSKQQRTSAATKDGNNISSKLLGAKVSDIKIEKFRDLTQYNKDKYEICGKFTLPMLKTITNKFSPQVMFTIVLPNQSISSIDPLYQCENLMILNLSRNSIDNISALAQCKELKIINFADNSINNVNQLAGCQHLVNVHLEQNMIKGMDQIKGLKECPALENVHFQALSGDQENPICSLNNYRQNILQFLEQIHRLDSVPREMEIHNGSELKLGKKKELKVQLKSVGPFYTSKFPTLPPYTVPNFPGEPSFKKSVSSCKSAINDFDMRLKAALAM